MKAKDTVMSHDQILQEVRKWRESHNKALIDYDSWYDIITLAQAEISFKAGGDKGYAHARQHCEDVIIPQAKAEGRREVVEWLENNFEPTVPMSLDYRKWHAKLEEWGNE